MTDTTIPLGFAVPGGERVTIPLGHMAVTGQTQSAGKTTALEALAMRSGCAVLAFVTKRGERAFVNAPVRAQVPPYLHERTDWEYVESILEAVMRERMKRERYWIMQVSRGAMTLAGVQANVKEVLARTKPVLKDYVAEQYHLLDAYLDKVVPQIGMLPAAREFTKLLYGINVMDLSPFSSELQGLVIASCLEYVFQHCVNTIVVIPEAWEFLPQGRKSPVTYAAEAFIRKGGTLKNYLWIDSQDLAGVHTPILKQIHVWLLGVQREINEIKRTLAHVHGVQHKPKPAAIAALGLGQFIACFEKQAITTFVQPVWMLDNAAARIAQGKAKPWPAPPAPFARAPIAFTEFKSAEDHDMDAQLKADNERLARDNQTLAARIAELEPIVDALREEIKHMRRELHVPAENAAPAATPAPERRAGTSRLHGRPLDDNGAIELTTERVLPPLPVERAVTPPITADLDWPYIRQQILADAAVIAAVVKIMAQRPELVVEIHPRVVTLKGDSLHGRLGRLIAEGYFDQPQLARDTNKELDRTGGMVHGGNLNKAFAKFVLEGFLVRSGDGYQRAPNLKVSTTELQAV